MDQVKSTPLKVFDVRGKYKQIDKVGRGTYGTVYKVLNLENNKYYAIKKFENTEAKLEVEGFPVTALRQISLLKQLNHPNVINLKEIICSRPNRKNLYRGSTFLVFDYMDHDFAGLFRNKIKFSLAELKCIMQQILEGCNYLHKSKIMHRDIKSANILLNDQGLVQLADFGLGRRTRFDNVYTHKVVTLWYRAPELLLGCKSYNHKIDVWSIGCVFAEFLMGGEVLFKKQTEYAIIQKIYEACGGLIENQYTEDYLKNCVYHHDMKPSRQYKGNLTERIKKFNPDVDESCLKFLEELLQLNPYKRLSCEEALNHEFFKTSPLPCKPEEIQKLDYQFHEMFKDVSLKIERKTQQKKERMPQEEQKRFNQNSESVFKNKNYVPFQGQGAEANRYQKPHYNKRNFETENYNKNARLEPSDPPPHQFQPYKNTRPQYDPIPSIQSSNYNDPSRSSKYQESNRPYNPYPKHADRYEGRPPRYEVDKYQRPSRHHSPVRKARRSKYSKSRSPSASNTSYSSSSSKSSRSYRRSRSKKRSGVRNKYQRSGDYDREDKYKYTSRNNPKDYHKERHRHSPPSYQHKKQYEPSRQSNSYLPVRQDYKPSWNGSRHYGHDSKRESENGRYSSSYAPTHYQSSSSHNPSSFSKYRGDYERTDRNHRQHTNRSDSHRDDSSSRHANDKSRPLTDAKMPRVIVEDNLNPPIYQKSNDRESHASRNSNSRKNESTSSAFYGRKDEASYHHSYSNGSSHPRKQYPEPSSRRYDRGYRQDYHSRHSGEEKEYRDSRDRNREQHSYGSSNYRGMHHARDY